MLTIWEPRIFAQEAKMKTRELQQEFQEARFFGFSGRNRFAQRTQGFFSRGRRVLGGAS